MLRLSCTAHATSHVTITWVSCVAHVTSHFQTYELVMSWEKEELWWWAMIPLTSQHAHFLFFYSRIILLGHMTSRGLHVIPTWKSRGLSCASTWQYKLSPAVPITAQLSFGYWDWAAVKIVFKVYNWQTRRWLRSQNTACFYRYH